MWYILVKIVEIVSSVFLFEDLVTTLKSMKTGKHKIASIVLLMVFSPSKSPGPADIICLYW